MTKIKIAIVGAGSRGNVYATFAKYRPEKMQIVAVSEPREYYRTALAKDFSISPGNCFSDWREMADKAKLADAVVIATPDNMHEEPAIAFCNKGYHLLLEKPMASTPQQCLNIVEAVKKNNVIFSVCHLLRYTKETETLIKLIKKGAIGEIITLQRLEPVGYWHYAHSFVRGNWNNSRKSSFMLLAKSCHDLDWIQYVINDKCLKVSSFGALSHFKLDRKPVGAGYRCTDCFIELDCPYSAKKIYVRDRANKGYYDWPINVITPELSTIGIMKALDNGPYGRCVYECNNDVVDHQIVNMMFKSGKTATFMMTAFTLAKSRITRILGTKGEIYCDGDKIEVFDFLTEKKEVLDVRSNDEFVGHNGGDLRMMDVFIDAILNKNNSDIISGPLETLYSHMIVFASEKARIENKVIDVEEYIQSIQTDKNIKSQQTKLRIEPISVFSK